MTDYSRQAFLGADAQTVLQDAAIGIVGYSGGGSHLGQQFAHIGIGCIRVFDPDIMDDSNLPRLVGGTPEDVQNELLKTEIAERVVRNVNPAVTIETYTSKWEEEADVLRKSDIVIGAVDDYATRDGLERFLPTQSAPLYRYRHGCTRARRRALFCLRTGYPVPTRSSLPALLQLYDRRKTCRRSASLRCCRTAAASHLAQRGVGVDGCRVHDHLALSLEP